MKSRRPDPSSASPQPPLSRRLWAARLVHRYPTFETRVAVAGRDDAPPGMALIRARLVRHLGRHHPVQPFYLDRAPVTNARFLEFLLATGEPPPTHWVGWRVPAGFQEHPVVGVSLDAARRYAVWRGARLPTELEWAGAARGPSGEQRFPWGERCDGLRCHCPLMGHNGPGQVLTHPTGATREGCEDLFGNVWEWTEASPLGAPLRAGRGRVLGGSYAQRCTAWSGLPATDVEARRGHVHVGFRCAADLPKTT